MPLRVLLKRSAKLKNNARKRKRKKKGIGETARGSAIGKWLWGDVAYTKYPKTPHERSIKIIVGMKFFRLTIFPLYHRYSPC